MANKTSFKNLDGWLKIAVIFGWLYALWITILFCIGFIEGFIWALS